MAQNRDHIPLVTVLTTVYNGDRYLVEAFDSILAQTFSDWEYVVVDDGSDDESPTIIERYVESDPRFRSVRREERGGPYTAANQGFACARGRYVARLDADDIALPQRLERQLEFLSANPGLRACATDIRLLMPDGVQDFISQALPVLPGTLKWRACVREMPMPSTTLIERSAWADLGGFRELPLSQDLRMWCDLARNGWLGLLPEPLVYWRRHTSQLSSVHGSGLQEDLAHEVLRDHLGVLDGSWGLEDIYRLRWAAFRPVGFLEGRRALARFETLWRRDGTLSEDERREMATLMRWLRIRHIRVNAKAVLSSGSLGRYAMQLRTRIRAKVPR
jgi:glycosyltransferase involved in cell wall biosynthesis